MQDNVIESILQQATRDFLAVAMRSVDQASHLPLPQMRLLFAIDDLPAASCAELGRELGIAGSTVTRLADRLVESELVERTQREGNRNVVLLKLTPAGRQVLDDVVAWRRGLFRGVLRRLPADSIAALRSGLPALHTALVQSPGTGQEAASE